MIKSIKFLVVLFVAGTAQAATSSFGEPGDFTNFRAPQKHVLPFVTLVRQGLGAQLLGASLSWRVFESDLDSTILYTVPRGTVWLPKPELVSAEGFVRLVHVIDWEGMLASGAYTKKPSELK